MMNKKNCTHRKSDGSPCRALALNGRPFCLFHDPDRAATLDSGRRKGGATPRRQIRRYPRRLREGDIAEVMSELLIDALNRPTAISDRRLRSLTRVAEALLKHAARRRGAPVDGGPASHGKLLRVYAPIETPRRQPTEQGATPPGPRSAKEAPAGAPATQRADRT